MSFDTVSNLEIPQGATELTTSELKQISGSCEKKKKNTCRKRKKHSKRIIIIIKCDGSTAAQPADEA